LGQEKKKYKKVRELLGKASHLVCSGAERTRTSDARFRKPTLYPLSYSPIGLYSIMNVNLLGFSVGNE
jgi:hypothetical protein